MPKFQYLNELRDDVEGDVDELSDTTADESEGSGYDPMADTLTPDPDATEIAVPPQWLDRMALVSSAPLPENLSPDDDIAREDAFEAQALASVTHGFTLLRALGVPFRRPPDFYVEMLKNDQHMFKVRAALDRAKQLEHEKLERRKQKAVRKYGKKVTAEVNAARGKDRKKTLDAVNTFRNRFDKQKDDGMFDVELGGHEDGDGVATKRGVGARMAAARASRQPMKQAFRPQKGGAKGKGGKPAAKGKAGGAKPKGGRR